MKYHGLKFLASLVAFVVAYWLVPSPVKAVATMFIGSYAGYHFACWDNAD